MISAALIQDLKPNTVVKVGDRVAVDAASRRETEHKNLKQKQRQ